MHDRHIHSIFDIVMAIKWKSTNQYIEGITPKYLHTDKWAWFDMDGTIIKTKSGKTFPVNSDDWQFLCDATVKKIKELSKDGFSIVIITNQAGIEKHTTNPDDWMKKVSNVQKQLNVEIRVLCSTGKNKFRKPFSSFYYDFFTSAQRDACDRYKSFYCGDACGRSSDHSDCDYKFAMNCFLTFVLPEQLFLNEHVTVPKIKYPTLTNDSIVECIPRQKHMIIMIGYQASGKSHYSEKYKQKHGYNIINQDTLKTRQKCLKMANKLMLENKCLIIDNTNPSNDGRKEYIDLAKKYGYTVSAVHITTSYELSMHRNHYRLLTKNYLIPEIAYRTYKKKFNEPQLSDGYCEILKMGCGMINDLRYLEFLF